MNVPNLRLVLPPDEPGAEPLSLDEAFRACSGDIATLALRLLGRRDQVEDVVHDTFLAARRGLETLRQRSEARTWLATVALRVVRRRLRLRKVRGLIGADDAQLTEPSASAHDRALLAALYQALDTLEVEERLAWSLRQLHGERLEEVAALCGCSLMTAKQRIASAQISLQEALGDE
jgi:RNA polymerase sigma-70 factor (ECF subfamily)